MPVIQPFLATHTPLQKHSSPRHKFLATEIVATHILSSTTQRNEEEEDAKDDGTSSGMFDRDDCEDESGEINLIDQDFVGGRKDK